MDTLDILKEQGILNLKNGSAELFFDDEGLLQKLIIRKRRRKREGEILKIIPPKKGNVIANYNHESLLLHITYETEWCRPKKTCKVY